MKVDRKFGETWPQREKERGRERVREREREREKGTYIYTYIINYRDIQKNKHSKARTEKYKI